LRPLERLTFFFDFSDIARSAPPRFDDHLRFPEACYGELQGERYPDLGVKLSPAAILQKEVADLSDKKQKTDNKLGQMIPSIVLDESF
jgi:hypothetical protein